MWTTFSTGLTGYHNRIQPNIQIKAEWWWRVDASRPALVPLQALFMLTIKPGFPRRWPCGRGQETPAATSMTRALEESANYFAPLPSRFEKYHQASAFEERKNGGELPASLNSILPLPRRQVPPHAMDKAETFGAFERERRNHLAPSTNRYGLDFFVHVQLRYCFVEGSAWMDRIRPFKENSLVELFLRLGFVDSTLIETLSTL